MPLNTSTKDQAILRALEMVEARIRFNEELKAFLLSCSRQEFKAYMIKFSPAVRARVEMGRFNDDRVSDEVKRQSVLLVDSDLKVLAALKSLINKILIDDNQVLPALQYIQLEMCKEEHRILRGEREEQNAMHELKRSNPVLFEKIKLTTKLKANYINPRDKTEFYLFLDLKELFIDSKLAGKMECDFVNRFYVLKFNDYGSYNATISKSLINTIPKLSERIIAMLDLLQQKKQHISQELATYIMGDLTSFSNKLNSYCGQTTGDVMSHEQMLDDYKFIYAAPKQVEEFEKYIRKELAAEEAWFLQQQKVQAEEQERQKAIDAAAHEQEQQRIMQLKLAKQEEERLLAIERSAAAERESLAKQELKRIQAKQFAELSAQRERDRVLRREQVEVQKIKNELTRRRERIAAISQSRVIHTDAKGKMHSSYKISDKLVSNNIDSLQQLFDPQTYAIPYLKARTLIERLGGHLDVKTGSSHQKLIFNGAVYNYVEMEEVDERALNVTAAPATACVKKGIARPHAGETELRGHNLKLLRDAIESMLSDEWRQKLRIGVVKKDGVPEAKTKMAFG